MRTLPAVLVAGAMIAGPLRLDAAAPAARAVEAPAGATVRHHPTGSWAPLRVGAPLAPGAGVRAGAGRTRLELRGGAVVEVAPGAQVTVAAPADVPLARGRAARAPHVALQSGEVAVSVTAAQAPLLLSGSGSVYAAVLAGVVRARADAHATAVAVYAGEARVATRGVWSVVPAGHVARLAPALPVPTPRPFVAPPAFRADEDGGRGAGLGLVLGEGRAPVRLRWSAPSGATGHLVEIARDADFREPLLSRDLPAELDALDSEPLEPGRYYARLSHRGPEGLPERWSAVRALRVARLRLPAGALADPATGTVLAFARSALEFDDPEGLEAAVARSGFAPAPARLALEGDAPLVARVRLAGERASIPLRIEPSPLRAVVELGPKRAVWPFDPVDIKVSLVDSRGLYDVASLEPTLRVTVNLKPVNVTFRREGAVFRGRLEPRVPPGPWIVRVEVGDAHGAELGRGFLEVVSAGAARGAAGR